LTNPTSLVSQILKVWYFPKGTFWEAQAGHQPSYIWRSILKARPILEHGTWWSIGNGATVRI